MNELRVYESPFHSFKNAAMHVLGVTEDPMFCWEVIYDIVEGTEPVYEFDFPHLRLSTDLMIAAVLLSIMKRKRVIVLEPTAYYSAQAIQMFWRWKIDAPLLQIAPAGATSISEYDVVMHHGRRFGVNHNPQSRIIVQIFKDEDVPQDSRSLSSLMNANYGSE